MTSKVVKSTSKGQITLPMLWRAKFKTENFMLKIEDQQITVKPVYIEEFATGEEKTVFDAQRDNEGKGISVDEMIKLLKKTK